MNNKEFGKHLEERTRNFAISILNLANKLPDNNELNIIKNQISRSGTSIGANYREANRSRSKSEFKSKIGISLSETNETVYWLEILEVPTRA